MNALLLTSAFALGCWWLQQQAALPEGHGAAIVVVLAGLALAARQKSYAVAALAAAVAAAAVAGFYWAAWAASAKLEAQLPVNWEGRDVVVEGTVAGMPQRHEYGSRLRFDVQRILTPGAEVPRFVVLGWYEDVTLPDGESHLQAGQRWRLAVRLQRPHGNYNPHVPDLERSLLEGGIRATGYVRRDPAPLLISQFEFSPRHAIARAREIVRERLGKALAGAPYRGVIVALAVGDQDAIPPAHWSVFTRTGVNHLMSISGLHITMIAGLLFATVNALWRRIPRLASRIPSRRAAALAGLSAAVAYGLLAGFAVPAQRTVFMLAVVAAALWSGWRWPTATILGAALGFVVILDPLAASSAGFWLSFGAVAALLLAATGRLQQPRLLASWVHSQWAVTVALTPLLIALFQQVSIVSPVANAMAIPMISLLVVPLALLAIVVPLDFLAGLAHAVLTPCMALLQWLAQVPAAAWQQHAPPSWAVAAALAGAVWLMLPRGFPARWLGASAMLPLFLVRPAGPAPHELWVTALDVGQGLAVVVRTSDHALLFDTGPGYLGGTDAGERIVVPYLRGEGVSRLDALIVSHDDTDHAGGALSVLAALPVARTLSSLPDSHPVHLNSRVSSRCERGQRWHWDGADFEVLHPAAGSYNRAPVKDNDRSCVLRVASGSAVVLITGDIEQASERELLLRLAGSLPATLLIAPHHGSRTSSSPDFVRTVGAEHVLFSSGHRNRFGHPHPLVAARYRAAGAHGLRTDVSGAVTFRFAPRNVTVEQWRLSEPRFWHGM